MKVEVVGGGPAGLRSAKLLASKNHDVVLYERGEIGEPLNCGELYHDIYSDVERPKFGRIRENGEVELEIMGEKKTMSGKFTHQYDRVEMEEGMRDEAEDAGANIVTGKRVDEPSEDILTIDASGYPSILLSSKEYERVLNAVSVRVDKEAEKMSCKFQGMFYYWVFPKSGESNVGCCSYKKLKNPSLKDRALNFAREMGNIKDYSGGPIPASVPYQLWYPTEKTILVGDAAGLCNPFTGAGIHTALLSAKIAVESIETEKIDNYERNLKYRVKKEMKAGLRALNLLKDKELIHLFGTKLNMKDFLEPSIGKKINIGIRLLSHRLQKKLNLKK